MSKELSEEDWNEISVLACYIKDELEQDDICSIVGRIIIPAVKKRIKELLGNG